MHRQHLNPNGVPIEMSRRYVLLAPEDQKSFNRKWVWGSTAGQIYSDTKARDIEKDADRMFHEQRGDFIQIIVDMIQKNDFDSICEVGTGNGLW